MYSLILWCMQRTSHIKKKEKNQCSSQGIQSTMKILTMVSKIDFKVAIIIFLMENSIIFSY